jgi:hypothetical protein
MALSPQGDPDYLPDEPWSPHQDLDYLPDVGLPPGFESNGCPCATVRYSNHPDYGRPWHEGLCTVRRPGHDGACAQIAVSPYRDYIRQRPHVPDPASALRPNVRVSWPDYNSTLVALTGPSGYTTARTALHPRQYDPEANYAALSHLGLDLDDFCFHEYQPQARGCRLKRPRILVPKPRAFLVPRGFKPCMNKLAAQQRLTVAKLFCSDFGFHDTTGLTDVGQHIVNEFCTSATRHHFARTPPSRRHRHALGSFATVWRLCEHLDCGGACQHTRSRAVLDSRPRPSHDALRELYRAYG